MDNSVALFANILLVIVFLAGFVSAIVFCKFWLYRREIKRGRSFSVVIHQLKSPLAAVKWTVDMMKKGELGPINADQKTFLDKSGESLERMTTMIIDLLEAHSLIDSPMPYELKEVDLISLTKQVVGEFEIHSGRKNLNLEFKHQLTDDKALVWGDDKKLRVIIENLIDNAIKYSEEGGKVGVLLEKEGNVFRLVVSDNGIGIPVADQDKIFTKYYRGTNTGSNGSGGSGLGLFIAREMAHKHNGDISFVSKPGDTRFSFTLPAQS